MDHYSNTLSSILEFFVILLICTTTLATDQVVERRELYLVQLEGESLVIPHLRNHLLIEEMKIREESHDRFLQSTLIANTYHKIYSFHHAINGFAIHTTPSQAKRLQTVEGVVIVEKDRGVETMSTYTPKFLGLRDKLWAQLDGPRNAGEGIVIGFVDSGINPTHPSFAYEPPRPNSTVGRVSNFSGSCYAGPKFPFGFCNGKIISARHFYAGAAAALPIPTVAELSPFDDLGHGSHVASIAAGNYGVPVIVNGFDYGHASGMAPAARIAVYKAIYREGGTLTDVVAAVDQAIRDRVDILTLAIGPDSRPVEIPLFVNIFEIVLLHARTAGVFVAQAAGNKGPASSTTIAFSPWTMAVAASSTDRNYVSTLALGNNVQLHGVGLSVPTLGNGSIQYKLVAAKDAAIANPTIPSTSIVEECQDPRMLRADVVRGNLVICTFSYGFLHGISSLATLLETARALEFRGFVFVANPALGSLVIEPLPLSIPGTMIPSIDDVKILMEYYETYTLRDPNGSVLEYGATAAIKEGRVASYCGKPVVASFSSRGPDVVDGYGHLVDVLKPDILAPGHQVWGAWSPISATQPILKGYNFALISGTSMSTPHVAGAAALIKQHRPSWNPSMIASAMCTTASKHDNLERPIMSSGYGIHSVNLSTPFDYGSGLINPSKALDPGLVFSSEHKDYIGFLCSIPGIEKSRVQNLTHTSCNNISLQHPADLNLPSITVAALNGSLTLNRQVMNVASRSETYTSSFLPPKGVSVDIQPSAFTILPDAVLNLQITLAQTNGGSREFSFGEIILTGSLDHVVRLPLSVLPVG